MLTVPAGRWTVKLEAETGCRYTTAGADGRDVVSWEEVARRSGDSTAAGTPPPAEPRRGLLRGQPLRGERIGQRRGAFAAELDHRPELSAARQDPLAGAHVASVLVLDVDPRAGLAWLAAKLLREAATIDGCGVTAFRHGP